MRDRPYRWRSVWIACQIAATGMITQRSRTTAVETSASATTGLQGEQPSPEGELVPIPVDQGEGERLVDQAQQEGSVEHIPSRWSLPDPWWTVSVCAARKIGTQHR